MQKLSRVRKRFTPEQREKIVKSYQESSLTQRQFALQAGISISGLQRCLRQRSACKPAQARFLPIPNLLGSPVGLTYAFRLQLPNAVVLELRPDFDPVELESLVRLAAGL